MITLLFVIIACHWFLSIRIINAPLHADSGQFLYRGFFSGLGKKFPYFRKSLDSFSVTIKNLFRFGGADYEFTAGLYEENSKKGYLPLCQKIGSYFLANLLGRLSRKNPKAFRYYLTFYNTLTILAVFYLGRISFGPTTGLAAAALFAAYINIPYADSRQIHAEHFLILPVILCVILIVLGTTYSLPVLLVTAGVACFLIFTLKSSAILEVIFLLLSPVIIGGGVEASLLMLVSFLFSFLVFLIILLINKLLIFYLYLALSVSSFIDYKKGINYSIHKEEFNFSGGSMVARFKMYIPFILQISFLVLGVVSFLSLALFKEDNLTIFLISWLLVELGSVFLQGKYYFSHLVVLLPPAVIITAAAFIQYLSIGNFGYLVVFFIILAINFNALFKYWFIYNPLEYHLRLNSSLYHPRTLSFAAVDPIADYIKKNTGNGDKIKLWGYNSEFYVMAGRQEHSGFHEDKVLCDPVQLDGFWGPVWRKWFLRDIKNDPPKYLIDFYGNLNVEFVNKITGLEYRLEKIFYSLFPVYKLFGRGGHGENNLSSADLSLLDKGNLTQTGKAMPLNEIIAAVTKLFINDHFDEADKMLDGGLSEIIRDWKNVNLI